MLVGCNQGSLINEPFTFRILNSFLTPFELYIEVINKNSIEVTLENAFITHTFFEEEVELFENEGLVSIHTIESIELALDTHVLIEANRIIGFTFDLGDVSFKEGTLTLNFTWEGGKETIIMDVSNPFHH